MEKKFEVKVLKEARDFILNQDKKVRKKITYNLKKAKLKNDPKVFKKLTDNIWEFRTLYRKKQYRLFAFWDKTKDTETLVICTHGIVKKSQKTPQKEIEKAERVRKAYFKT